MKNQKQTPSHNRVAWYGMLVALAMMASYLELFLPINFGIPGIKLGLANIVVVCVLYLMGTGAAFFVSLLRIILSGILFGNVFGILYSLAGGLLSFLVMALAKRYLVIFGIPGVSILGGIFHNIGQVAVAVLVVENLKIAFYLPLLVAAGAVTGAGNGLLSQEMVRRFPQSWKEKWR